MGLVRGCAGADVPVPAPSQAEVEHCGLVRRGSAGIRARERLPDGADAMAYLTGSNPDEAAARFRNDLDFMLGKLRQFKNVVSAQAAVLARLKRPWRERALGHLKLGARSVSTLRCRQPSFDGARATPDRNSPRSGISQGTDLTWRKTSGDRENVSRVALNAAATPTSGRHSQGRGDPYL